MVLNPTYHMGIFYVKNRVTLTYQWVLKCSFNTRSTKCSITFSVVKLFPSSYSSHSAHEVPNKINTYVAANLKLVKITKHGSSVAHYPI